MGQLLSTHLCHLDVSIHSIFSIVIELEQFNAVGIFGPDESFSHRIGENKANDVGCFDNRNGLQGELADACNARSNNGQLTGFGGASK